MRVLRLVDAAPNLQLVEATAPPPEAEPGHVLIRVHAAGITPTELSWYPTSHTKSGEKRVGAIPGHEFSGVVAGAGNEDIQTGQAVFGMNDWFAEGAMADFCIAPASSVAPKPAGLSHAEAASIPIGALTAWQGLYERAKLQSGERVLVHGGAGAVGVYAIQLAKLRGAYVVATAPARNVDFVAGLGADQVLDYRTTPFDQVVSEIDVVFDGVGGDVLDRSWSVLKPGGRMVTIAANGEQSTDNRVRDAFFIVESNQKQLIQVGALVEAGHLRPVVDRVIPLAQAADAYGGRLERSGRGKVVVTFEA